MTASPFSWLLVILQLGLLLALAGTGPWWPAALWSRSLVVAGAGLGGWAVATMRLRQLRATPEPAPGAHLVAHGPYRWIRHPMYAATLLVAVGWLGGHYTGLRLALAAGLAVVLVIKLHYEERLLMQRLPGYPAYASRTRRLVPWLW